MHRRAGTQGDAEEIMGPAPDQQRTARALRSIRGHVFLICGDPARCNSRPPYTDFPFSLAFAFDCDLVETESEIAKMNWRTPGKRLLDRIFDLAIIGGGVNGCGIRRAAAGRRKL